MSNTITSSTEYREFLESLVSQAEADAKRDPEAYRTKLRNMALLGYGFLAAILLTVGLLVFIVLNAALGNIFIFAFLLKSKLIFILLPLMWVMVSALFVKLEEPEGIEIKSGECPRLWAELEALQESLGTPEIDKVVITPDLNAGISQIPRFGITGPSRNILILGIDLLLCLSPDQARAVLAHEFAHLSNNHSRFSNWIYRLRRMWGSVEAAFENYRIFGVGLIRRFLNWYAPRFQGYSFVLARDNEYEADAQAVSLTSAETMASALVHAEMYATLAQEYFWQPLFKQAYTNQQPPNDIYMRLNEFYSTLPGISPLEKKRHVQQALTRDTHFADTHPRLLERLKAIRQPGKFEEKEIDAAKYWLGNKRGQLLKQFSAWWINAHQDNWRAFNEEASHGRARVKEIEARMPDLRTREEMWQLASFTEKFLPDLDSIPHYVAYHRKYRQDPKGMFALGRLLLEKGNEKGVQFLTQSLKRDAYRISALECIWDFYRRRGDQQQAEHWLRKLEAAGDDHARASRERQSLSSDDRFFKPDLSPEQFNEAESIVNQLNRACDVDVVWIAQKEVINLKEIPLLIFAIDGVPNTPDPEIFQAVINDRSHSSFDFYVLTRKSCPELFPLIKSERFFIRPKQ